MCAPERSPHARQRGISLVEIMVGMVVALLIGLAATGSAAVFTASQRQGIGAGGISVNANTALAALKGEAATAGLGFFGDSKFLCYSLDLSSGSSVKYNAASFAPLRVTADGSNSKLDMMYATSVDSGANVMLKGTSDGTSATLASLLPVTNGQAVLLSPGTPSATKPCVVRTVTAVTDATNTSSQVVSFASSGTYNGATFSTAPSFSADPGKDRIAVIGDLRWSRYSVSSGKLILERPLDGTSATLMRNVVAFRVQYGITGTGATDTTLAGWQDASGTDFGTLAGATVERVRALRIGLVTRSPQPEKPNKAGRCEASASKPTLFGATVEPDVTDWQCWRFRSAVVVVPLRNFVW
jgi:type IV pilus assembly protein PilW